MTREELREHCKKQIEMCEMWAKHHGEEPHGKVYEEHKMILELLQQKSCEDNIVEWKRDFKGYINSLSMPRDDYKGIMEYINEVPNETNEDLQDALHIAQTERDKWKARAIKLSAILGIRDCDIEPQESEE